MDYESYKQALLAEPFDEISIEHIIDEYYMSGTPFVFLGDASAEGRFKRTIANEISSAFNLRCHPQQIEVCGSAHLGFSAAPTDKLGNEFSFTASDIDIAVLLPELFDRWWIELVAPAVALGERRRDIADHLLNGFINPQFVRNSTNTGKRWWELFGNLDGGNLKRVRGRIYRDHQFMQNYHRLSVIRGREKLLGAKA